jgi:gas vesicle protein
MNTMQRPQVCDFLIGVGVGAATALLLAPQTGRKTRSRITDAAADGTAFLKDRGETVGAAAFGVMKRRKEEIARHLVRNKEGLAEALKRGTQAYRRAIS